MAKSSFSSIINDTKPTLIDFYADWCGPCKAFTPILKSIKTDLGDKIKILKIDVDKNQMLAQKLNVMSIPTVMIYHKGKRIYSGKGVHSKEDLKTKLTALIE